MQFRNVLVTGGAGFVGSTLALAIRARYDGVRVLALDNLQRKGSDRNVERLRAGGVSFVKGDIRRPEDLEHEFDLLIECAAEPSVSAGMNGSPNDVLQPNLVGALHCFEAARTRSAAVLLLSTSRVYPIAPVNALPFVELETRYAWQPERAGIDESFPLDGPRSLYGASKLAAELVLREYVHSYGMPALVNRCGVIAGPYQLSRVDQGVVGLWMARHYYRRPLRYIGFGGTGKQVRDVLHVDDLVDLVVRQLETLSLWDGAPYNVGGGPERTVSLRELTSRCAALTGNTLELGHDPATSSVDVRIYVTDASRVEKTFDWRPTRSVDDVLRDVLGWITGDPEGLREVLAA